MEAMTLIQQLRGRAAFLRDKGRIKSPGLMEQAADALEAHLAQPAQAVDVGALLQLADKLDADARPRLEQATSSFDADDCAVSMAYVAMKLRALSGEKAGRVGGVPLIKPVLPDDADIDRWRAIGWNECRNAMLDAGGLASEAKYFLVQGVNREETPVLLFSSKWFADQYCKQNPQPDGYYQIYAAIPASPTPDKEGQP